MAEDEMMELPFLLDRGERDQFAVPREPVVLDEVRVRRELYEDRYTGWRRPPSRAKKRSSNLFKNSKRCWKLHNGRLEWHC